MVFENGCLVHRVWESSGSSELLATFQYAPDARDFCRAPRDKNSDLKLVMTNIFDGKQEIFRFTEPENTSQND